MNIGDTSLGSPVNKPHLKIMRQSLLIYAQNHVWCTLKNPTGLCAHNIYLFMNLFDVGFT